MNAYTPVLASHSRHAVQQLEQTSRGLVESVQRFNTQANMAVASLPAKDLPQLAG